MKKRLIAIIAVAALALATITPAIAGSTGYEGQPGHQSGNQGGGGNNSNNPPPGN